MTTANTNPIAAWAKEAAALAAERATAWTGSSAAAHAAAVAWSKAAASFADLGCDSASASAAAVAWTEAAARCRSKEKTP